jgi:two-component sensor histidine kinase
VSVKVRCDPLSLGTSKAVAVGLIVNELVVNALKHAFPSNRPGAVSVDVVEESDSRRIRVTISDDGIGGPTDSDDGLGSRLVRLLARQHGGDVERQSSASGYTVTATLSLDPPA